MQRQFGLVKISVVWQRIICCMQRQFGLVKIFVVWQRVREKTEYFCQKYMAQMFENCMKIRFG